MNIRRDFAIRQAFHDGVPVQLLATWHQLTTLRIRQIVRDITVYAVLHLTEQATEWHKPRKRRTPNATQPLMNPLHQQWVESYRAGTSLTAIAQGAGVSKQAVLQALQRLKIEHVTTIPVKYRTYVKQYRDATPEQRCAIAETLGMSPRALSRAMAKYINVPLADNLISQRAHARAQQLYAAYCTGITLEQVAAQYHTTNSSLSRIFSRYGYRCLPQTMNRWPQDQRAAELQRINTTKELSPC